MRLLWILLAFATAVQASTVDSGSIHSPELKPAQQQMQAAHLSAELLTRYHYKAIPLDNALSEKIFDQYLKLLDSEKIFFTQSDIDKLAAMRDRLDDAILKEDLSIPFEIYNLFIKRVSDRLAFARGLLNEGFDFSQKDTYQYTREKEPWLKSEIEARELWRKRVKNDWLLLKLNGKEDKDIAASLQKRYEGLIKRVSRAKGEDAFQAFMNAYTMAIEPHTNYMGPRAAKEFDISMKLSLVGIGGELSEKDDYITIMKIMPGGPASLSGQLNVGDRIIGVAQGSTGIMTEIIGWRLDDAIALIRGVEGTVVQLDVLPAAEGPDGMHRLVSLVRQKITLDDEGAKKSVLSVKDGKLTRRIGVITLPSFYQDFEARQQGDLNFKSATHDVARLLDELKKDKVDSVLIDLRNNGGGSLSEAVELTGLFIGSGPVVQQRDAMGKVTVQSSSDINPAWDGPIGVLINRGSASASEIFAAAIQDYGRGLVIGESSFGKGTVQTMVDLDQIANNGEQKYGELKMTIAQFFRINGGTTQLLGVKPDIAFPMGPDSEKFGESNFDNALPWTQIKSVTYSPSGHLIRLIPSLVASHQDRVSHNKEFKYLQENIAQFSMQHKNNLISLNETERRMEREAKVARSASHEKSRDLEKNVLERLLGRKSTPSVKLAIQDDQVMTDESNPANDLSATKMGKNEKDVLLDEAVHILSDEVSLIQSGPKVASHGKSAIQSQYN
ncbi:MAG: carboxy terminal-processing peptidase [Sterolibacterium sp.]